MKVLNFGDITITPGDKQGLQNVIKEITKGETNMAVGRAWLLWFACTLRDKTDDQIKNSVFRGMGEKKIFIQWQ